MSSVMPSRAWRSSWSSAASQAQLAEVEVYVAAVARASLVFREEFAVGCELEEVALVAQVVRGLFLGTQLEGYALLLEVLYLLLDREDRFLSWGSAMLGLLS